jgi:DNA integrity scanning protein DisA with diadenylate cyclase activity
MFNIFLMTIAITIVAYLVGDLIILRLGNTIATIGDAVLSFGLLWYFTDLFDFTAFNRLASIIISVMAITVIEVLFHIYMKNHIYPDHTDSYIPTVTRRDGFATEFSREWYIKNKKRK